MNKVLVITGPTATGKTDLAINLAKKFNGELIACDSRQVYKDLDIGTGKLPNDLTYLEKKSGYWIINRVKIWMYDVLEFREQYSAWNYILDSNKAIEKIIGEGKLPIIVGGSGLYLRALLKGLDNNTTIDPLFRQYLQSLPLEKLQLKLKKKDPKAWEVLNQSDRQNK